MLAWVPAPEARLCHHICFPGLRQQIAKNWVAENNTDLSSYCSGGQKCKIKVSAGLVPPGGSVGESVSCLSPDFKCVRQSLACSRIAPISLCLRLHMAILNLERLHPEILHLVTSAKTLFSKKDKCTA